MEERLKKFALLIDSGSFTNAARLTHTSQPAISNSIQKLERELKQDLILRGSRRLKLTPAGELAYKQGKTLLLMSQNLEHEIRTLRSKKQPLGLGCIDSVADTLVRDSLISKLERDCELSLTVQSTSMLTKALVLGELDLIVVAKHDEVAPNLESYSIGNEKLVLVCSPSILNDANKKLTGGQLNDFLAYNKNSTTYKLIQSQLLNTKVTILPRFYSTNPMILLRLAIQGRGVAVLPEAQVREHIGNELVELKIKKPLYRPLVAYWQNGRRLPSAIDDFLIALQKINTKKTEITRDK